MVEERVQACSVNCDSVAVEDAEAECVTVSGEAGATIVWVLESRV